MSLLIIGLLLFIGMHSVGLFAPNIRQCGIAKLGVLGWKGVYSLVSIVGFVLIVKGYAMARLDPVWLYFPPAGLRHASALLSTIAMVFLAAYLLPKNAIKSKMGHPMYLAVKTWAVAHLLANGALADLILFGSFLAWAVVGFIIRRKQDRATGKQACESRLPMTIATIVLGIALTGAFVMHLHGLLIGVKPFG